MFLELTFIYIHQLWFIWTIFNWNLKLIWICEHWKTRFLDLKLFWGDFYAFHGHKEKQMQILFAKYVRQAIKNYITEDCSIEFIVIHLAWKMSFWVLIRGHVLIMQYSQNSCLIYLQRTILGEQLYNAFCLCVFLFIIMYYYLIF